MNLDHASAQTDDAAPYAVRFDAVTAGPLQGVSFALGVGSVHFVTGVAGAGKSWLLDLIADARPPQAGAISLLGQEISRLKPAARPALRRRVGRVFQDLRLIEHLSVRDNAALSPLIAGKKPATLGPDLTELLTWAGLAKHLESPAGDLKESDRRRLAIARAMAGGPDILLADEPAGDLEGPVRATLLRLLATLNRAGTTLIIATRDETIAARSGAPTLHLKDGELRRYEAAAREDGA